MKNCLPFSRLTVGEGLVGLGFLTMLIGAAGADSDSLVFTAVMVAIGAVLCLVGRKGIED